MNRLTGIVLDRIIKANVAVYMNPNVPPKVKASIGKVTLIVAKKAGVLK
jgi:hypothetical protein